MRVGEKDSEGGWRMGEEVVVGVGGGGGGGGGGGRETVRSELTQGKNWVGGGVKGGGGAVRSEGGVRVRGEGNSEGPGGVKTGERIR